MEYKECGNGVSEIGFNQRNKWMRMNDIFSISLAF